MRLHSIFSERERIAHLTTDERGQVVLVVDATEEALDQLDLLGDEVLDASKEDQKALRRAGYLWSGYLWRDYGD
jgi:hypothetical protein